MLDNYVVKKICLFLVFISVLCMSMINAQLFGVSLNKLGLIPFALAMIISFFSFRELPERGKAGLPFYLMMISLGLALVSSFGALSWNASFINREKTLFLFIIQLFIYLAIMTLLAIHPRKSFLAQSTLHAIVWVARVQALWALIQFLAYSMTKTDINTNLLGFLFGAEYQANYINLPAFGGIFLRVTGLNTDAAFLGLFLILGFVFDRKVLFKILYFGIAVIALSRSTIVCLAIILLINLLLRIRNRRLSKRIVAVGAVLVVAAIVVSVSVPSISSYVSALVGRFSTMGSSSDGSGRHVKYFGETIHILLYKFDAWQFIFGNGPRVSGSTMAYYTDNPSIFTDDMFRMAWAVESDFAELLLGYGTIGALCYAIHIIILAKYSRTPQEKITFIMFLIFGLMYDISALGIIFLIRMVWSSRPVEPQRARFLGWDEVIASRPTNVKPLQTSANF